MSELRLSEFAELVLSKHTGESGRDRLPRITVDECANHPLVRETCCTAVRDGLASAAIPLWAQLRRLSDGNHILFSGSAKGAQLPPGEELGVQVRKYSYSDARILQVAVANFFGTDQVVLLTENRRKDQEGLHCLIH